MQKIQVTENEAGQRIDKLLSKYLAAAPKSFLCKMLRKKNITLNGKRAEPGSLLAAGDEISLWLSDETIRTFSAEKPEAGRNSGKKKRARNGGKKCPDAVERGFGIPIVYEDAQLLIADKPAGCLSQKAAASDTSVNEMLLSILVTRGEMTEEKLRMFRPSVCNRLDRNTSGLITFAKTYPAARALSELFAGRSLQKYYLTLVKGCFREERHETAWLLKDAKTNRVHIFNAQAEGSERIETAFRPLWIGENATLLEVRLFTGKAHQIRAQLKFMGYPVYGDPKYGDQRLNASLLSRFGLNRQLLHAFRMVFPDALSGALKGLSGRTVTTTALPADFARVLRAETGAADTDAMLSFSVF